MARRYRGGPVDVGAAANHFMRNYLVSRYGMSKTRHAVKTRTVNRPGAAPAPDARRPAPEGISASEA
jgi:hypothetical protein